MQFRFLCGQKPSEEELVRESYHHVKLLLNGRVLAYSTLVRVPALSKLVASHLGVGREVLRGKAASASFLGMLARVAAACAPPSPDDISHFRSIVEGTTTAAIRRSRLKMRSDVRRVFDDIIGTGISDLTSDEVADIWNQAVTSRVLSS